MKIVVIGTRGIPHILGGVETHCEELFPRIVASGHDVTVIRRSSYITDDNKITEYKGVKLSDVFAPRSKSLEAIIHTFLAVIAAKRLRPDILHIHAIGPSIMTPFARMLGLKVVVTHHGPDYNRAKWGIMAKSVLKLGERMSALFANKMIVISQPIASLLKAKYNRNDTVLIYNGVPKPQPSKNIYYINSLGISPHRYIFAAGRFVPEKNFHLLIDAFIESGLDKRGYRLVIAGDSDHPDKYSESLKAQARNSNVILTGFIKGEALNQLFTNSSLFVLPSSHEGLPITLLEAMSYGLDVLISDIPANRLPQLKPEDFVKVNDVHSLADGLKRKINNLTPSRREYDLSPYDWENIARQTVTVYESLVHQS